VNSAIQAQTLVLNNRPIAVDADGFPQIIGLYSSVPQSGKSTLAVHARIAYNYAPMHFALPLKAMLGNLLKSLNPQFTEQDIYRRLYGDLKESHVPFLEKSTRELMQTLGTDWGRNMVHPDLWVMAFDGALRLTTPTLTKPRVIIDDLRFPNEFEYLHMKGGIVVRVTRLGQTLDTDHASEGALDDYPFDAHIMRPSGAIADLQADFDTLLHTIRTQPQKD
jgi:hypothetical protein